MASAQSSLAERSLRYALSRPLHSDTFVFRRTINSIIAQIETNGLGYVVLCELEAMIKNSEVLGGVDELEEVEIMEELDELFGNSTEKNKIYLRNVEKAKDLLRLIEHKKKNLV